MKIALTGKMRSGKDTVACMLTDDFTFTKVAFSDGIWETIKIVLPECLEAGVKPRGALVDVGQALREKFPTVWIDYTDREIRALGDENVIITDCRQINEYEYLKKAGFTIVKVEALEHIRKERMKEKGEIIPDELFNNVTERTVDMLKADYIIHNNSTYHNLLGEVKDFYKWYFLHHTPDIKYMKLLKERGLYADREVHDS